MSLDFFLSLQCHHCFSWHSGYPFFVKSVPLFLIIWATSVTSGAFCLLCHLGLSLLSAYYYFEEASSWVVSVCPPTRLTLWSSDDMIVGAAAVWLFCSPSFSPSVSHGLWWWRFTLFGLHFTVYRLPNIFLSFFLCSTFIVSFSLWFTLF